MRVFCFSFFKKKMHEWCLCAALSPVRGGSGVCAALLLLDILSDRG